MRFALGCAAAFAGVTGCTSADGTNTATGPSATANPPASAPGAMPSSTPAATPTSDGCPPDVNLMFEWLKATPEIVNKLDKSLYGLEQPVCYQGWSVAYTRVRNADPTLVLFKMDPGTGRWNPVAAGTDGVCDGVKVPEAIQAKLGPAC